jgi:hypothetical protein
MHHSVYENFLQQKKKIAFDIYIVWDVKQALLMLLSYFSILDKYCSHLFAVKTSYKIKYDCGC